MLSAIFPIYREKFISMDMQNNLSFSRLFLDREYSVPETVVGLSWKKYPNFVKSVEICEVLGSSVYVERIFAHMNKTLIPFVSRYRYPHTTHQYIHPQNISTIFDEIHGDKTNIISTPLYLLNCLSSCMDEPKKYSKVPANALTILETIQYEDLTIHSMVPDSYSLAETWRNLCYMYDFISNSTYDQLHDAKYLLPKIPSTDALLMHLHDGIGISKYVSFGFNTCGYDTSGIKINTQPPSTTNTPIVRENFHRVHLHVLAHITITDIDITICLKDKSYTIHYVVDRLSRTDESTYQNDITALKEFSSYLAMCVTYFITHIRIIKSFHEEAVLHFMKDGNIANTLYLDFCGLSLSSPNLVKY